MNLNQIQEEKKRYIRYRSYQIAITILLLLVLSGTTALAFSKIDVIGGFFSGETGQIQQDIHEPKTSVSDGNFRITLEQTLSDEFTTVVIFSVEALNQQAQKMLNDENNNLFMTPDSIKFNVNGQMRTGRGMGGSLTEYDTDTKRYWSLFIEKEAGLGENAVLETTLTGKDGKPLTISLPVGNHMESYTIPINLKTEGPDQCMVYKIGISNISLNVEHENQKYDPINPTEINIFFKMKDGSIKTKNQLIDAFGSNGVAMEGGHYLLTYRFASVLDLNNVESVIVCDMEFPLRGGEPKPFIVDPTLKGVNIGPFFLEDWQAVPLTDLCAKLGADLNYDEKAGIVSVNYRGNKLAADTKQNIWKLDDKTLNPSEKYSFVENGNAIFWLEGKPIIKAQAFEALFNVEISFKHTEGIFSSEDGLDYMEKTGRYYRVLP